MRYPPFIAENPPLALYALLATATSGFGQTFFISVFGSGIRADFSLSNSLYGFCYGLATLCSALLLLKVGELPDRWTLRNVTRLALALLFCGCLIIGLAPHWLLLIPGFLLSRLGGQALLSHLGMTVAGRYFKLRRGRIMALTAAGFPLAEATLPAGAGLLILYSSWRIPWLVAAALLLLIAAPLLLGLARRAAPPWEVERVHAQTEQPSLTRGQALRDPGFYLLLPAALVTPFSVTAMLFHQSVIAELRGWSADTLSLAFSGFALGHLASLLLAGPLVDRLGGQRALPPALLPLTAGLLTLALADAAWTPYLYLGLTGATLGMVSAAAGALWPERYGTRHIGAIRAIAQAAMVFATALAPLVVGAMLDAGLTPAVVALSMALLVALCAALTIPVKTVSECPTRGRDS